MAPVGDDMTRTDLEGRVLSLLLDGEAVGLETLRKQLSLAKVTRREFTGVGFFSTLEVPEHLPRLSFSGQIAFGDVQLGCKPLKDGAGFVLFLEDGELAVLEAYTYGDDFWPDSLGKSDDTTKYEVSYFGRERDFGALAPHI